VRVGVDEGEPGRERQVEHARLRHGRLDRDARVLARRLVRERVARRSPERKLPTGRVPDRNHASEVERRVDIRQEVDSCDDVEEGRRPPAARSHAPVFEVPRGQPVRGEVVADAGHQRAVVLRASVAAVHHDTHPMWTRPRGHEQLSELARVRAVGVHRAVHAPGRIRTCGLALRRRALYPLSYGRGERPVYRPLE
jgi:hypothetical protein